MLPQEQGRKLIEVFLTITGKWFWNSKPVSMEEKKKKKGKKASDLYSFGIKSEQY